MKRYYVFILAAVLSIPAAQAATVTVEDNGTTTVVQQGASVAAVQPITIVDTQTRDPREIEGEIIKVDLPESQILVQDIDGRERRIDLKQGMIGQYKVGDYVEIYLMADMKEAKTIHTRRVADIEGEITTIDYSRNLIVIRQADGGPRNVIVRPGLIGEHKVGDRVKLYVADTATSPETVRLIRVR